MAAAFYRPGGRDTSAEVSDRLAGCLPKVRPSTPRLAPGCRAAGLIEEYRDTYNITDPEQTFGEEQGDFLQRQERREVEAAVARVQERDQTWEHGLAMERTREWAGPSGHHLRRP